MKAKAIVENAAASQQVLQLSENVIYLMGLSFVLGSFFSILVLILLDYMQRNNPKR